MEEVGTHMAEITEFVPLEAVDPVYFDKAYYLAPDKGGAKPYALLASALRESKRCALGRWAARGKQYIVMIRPVEDGLVMQQLLYAGEVRAMKDLEIPKTEVKPAELKLAQQLIEQQTSETFDPSQYTDEVAARIDGGRAEEGRGPGDHAGRGARKAAARKSSISWKRCAPASRRKAPARAPRPPSPSPPPQRASRRSGRSRSSLAGAGGAQGCQEIKPARAEQPRSAQPVRRPRRREVAAPVAQHDPLVDRAPDFVAPARGPRGAWLFSFQDLIVLRTAQALADAKVPPRRITRSLRELRRHLPDAMPLSGLAHQRGGRPRRRARGRQPLAGGIGPIPARVRWRSCRRLAERDRARRPARTMRAGAQEWFDKAVALGGDGRRSGAAGVRAAPSTPIRRSSMPTSTWGGCCTTRRRFAQAERVYRDALKVLRQRSGAALQPRRAPRRHGSRRRTRWRRTRRR